MDDKARHRPGRPPDARGLRAAARVATVGITLADATAPDLPLQYCNPAFEHLTGYTADDVLGRNCRFLQREERDQRAVATMRQALQAGHGCTVVLRNYRQDGTPFWNEVTLSPVHDDDGVIVQWVGIQHDISRIIRAEQRLADMATRDALTGLPNLALFSEHLTHALARAQREESEVALLMIGLDDFTALTLRTGPGQVDELVRTVAERLHRTMRDSDLLARLDEERFVLLLGHADDAQAASVLAAERINDQFVRPFVVEDQIIPVSASIGISAVPRDAADEAALLEHAEAAMSRAREAGGDRYRVYTEY